MLSVSRITEMMDRRGWGSGELATYSGVSYDTVYKFLNTDRPRPSAIIVAKIARALGCSMEYLMGMTDIAAPGAGWDSRAYATIEDPEERQIVQKLLDDISALSPGDKAYAADVIRRLIPRPPRIIGGE